VTQPVSVVVPCLADVDLLERSLPPLLAELERRDEGDEVVVVDDTGKGVLAAPLARSFPDVRVVSRESNGGFARALLFGAEHARHDLVFSMNPDVRVRDGFLDPLVACLEEDDVFAAVPRVLLGGEEKNVESLTALEFREGFVHVNQPGLGGRGERQPYHPVPVAFGVGGTLLFRRHAFLELGGFDPMYEPFYWEDVDLGWTVWREGKRVLYQPASVVEHHHRGTIGRVVDGAVTRAAIEKNRLLFQWKHLDDKDLLRSHVAALYRMVIDAWLSDDRDELLWLNLALDQADQALEGRTKLKKKRGRPGFRAIVEATTSEWDELRLLAAEEPGAVTAGAADREDPGEDPGDDPPEREA